MRKTIVKKIAVFITFSMLLSAVSTKAATKGYYFKNKGVSVSMHSKAEKFIKKAGKPIRMRVKKSCAYEGKDRIYVYSDFVLYTYSNSDNGKEYVDGITFLNNNVKTAEGITIGSTYNQMVKKYGKTKNNFGIYTYRKGKCRIQMEIKNKKVKNLRYIATK